jgi:hypothetical protein
MAQTGGKAALFGRGPTLLHRQVPFARGRALKLCYVQAGPPGCREKTVVSETPLGGSYGMPGCRRGVAAGLRICVSWWVSSIARGPAQVWRDRSIRIGVPFAPGGATDLTALWADELSAFGPQFAIENRDGEEMLRDRPGVAGASEKVALSPCRFAGASKPSAYHHQEERQ